MLGIYRKEHHTPLATARTALVDHSHDPGCVLPVYATGHRHVRIPAV